MMKWEHSLPAHCAVQNSSGHVNAREDLTVFCLQIFSQNFVSCSYRKMNYGPINAAGCLTYVAEFYGRFCFYCFRSLHKSSAAGWFKSAWLLNRWYLECAEHNRSRIADSQPLRYEKLAFSMYVDFQWCQSIIFGQSWLQCKLCVTYVVTKPHCHL